MTHAFHIKGKDPAPKPYHYTECGLDDVYLANGFHVKEFDGEQGVSIECLDALHECIGVHLIQHRKRLSAKDFRFLRKEMRMTQSEIADLLDVSDLTVIRWETGVITVPGPADRAMRLFYLVSTLDDDSMRELLSDIQEMLGELNQRDEASSDINLVMTDTGWSDTSTLYAH